MSRRTIARWSECWDASWATSFVRQPADGPGSNLDLGRTERGLGSDALLRLADALGTSLDYLVKGELDAPRPRPPLVIPPELAEAAEERRWSLGEARDLLKARQLVVARRSQGPDADDPQRRLTKEEWFALYDRLFG